MRLPGTTLSPLRPTPMSMLALLVSTASFSARMMQQLHGGRIVARSALCGARGQRHFACTLAEPAATAESAVDAGGKDSSAAEVEELVAKRIEKSEQMRQIGVEPYAYSYAASHLSTQLSDEFASLEAGEVDDAADVSVCGRVLAKRGFGKLSFWTVQDGEGTLQLYLEKKRIGDGFKQMMAQTDIGDLVGARGSVKRTDKGELSVYAHEVTMLTKTLRPLPDKWAGLTDLNKRYRQRYLDMIVNPQVRDTFRTRARITSFIRRYLDDQNFLEIETPSLHATAGGAEARPFETHHNALDLDLTLRIATELHLKRLIIGGFDRVYECGRIFRNEGISTRHNPEFTSIEIYQVGRPRPPRPSASPPAC